MLAVLLTLGLPRALLFWCWSVTLLSDWWWWLFCHGPWRLVGWCLCDRVMVGRGWPGCGSGCLLSCVCVLRVIVVHSLVVLHTPRLVLVVSVVLRVLCQPLGQCGPADSSCDSFQLLVLFNVPWMG